MPKTGQGETNSEEPICYILEIHCAEVNTIVSTRKLVPAGV